MKPLVVLFLSVLAWATPNALTAGEPQSFTARARALDGDTIAADFRLLGVDAFERRQLCERNGSCWECGKAAQDLAARTLRDNTATISLTAGSSYDRPVATVIVNGRDLGELLIRAGLAVPQPQYLRSDQARAALVRLVIDDGVVLTVGNALPSAAGAAEPGNGIAGMRQRAELLGGRLRAGPAGDEWVVRAEFSPEPHDLLPTPGEAR